MARITLDHINDQFVSEQFHSFPGTMMIVCCLTLKNGFNVVGQAACADPSIFDEEIGRTMAKKDAISKIWPLEGYRLKQALYEEQDVTEFPK